VSGVQEELHVHELPMPTKSLSIVELVQGVIGCDEGSQLQLENTSTQDCRMVAAGLSVKAIGVLHNTGWYRKSYILASKTTPPEPLSS